MRWLLTGLVIAAAGIAAAQDAHIGERLYDRYCGACHGETGAGDGPMTRVLTPPPPDLTRLAAQNDGTFPRRRVVWRIDGRDPILAHGNEMPVFGELLAGEALDIRDETGEVLHSTQPMADLLAFLESLQVR
ncbi:c-type cytochrome [Roseovarius ramblicola]|uniref:C-type cytochrome n=1 Tax=Roseovarius ramblicola TaxID=2022336 RepID=A0ABV5HZR5_9RHOB